MERAEPSRNIIHGLLDGGNYITVSMTYSSSFLSSSNSQTVTTEGPTSRQLQVAMIPVLPNNLCHKQLKEVKGLPHQIDEKVMCAGYLKGGTDSCDGDSGGPLMWGKVHEGDIFFYLIGVVSWGYKCAVPKLPGVYTRITHYINWIEKQLY